METLGRTIPGDAVCVHGIDARHGARKQSALALFVFWELTGFTSFLLIGFDHERRKRGLLPYRLFMVTGIGGMGLLAAAVLGIKGVRHL